MDFLNLLIHNETKVYSQLYCVAIHISTSIHLYIYLGCMGVTCMGQVEELLVRDVLESTHKSHYKLA